MQIFNSYDSPKLLKEKFQVLGLKFTGDDERIKEINSDLNKLAISDFKDEISRKFSIIQLFEEDNGEAMLEIYSKYFEIPEDYFSNYFVRKFFNPGNFNSDFLETKKQLILKNYSEFSEIYFDEDDFDKLKLSYLLHSIHKNIENSWNKRCLAIFYNDFFKKASGPESAVWKSNSKVRKILFLENFFNLLDKFDKLEILNYTKTAFEKTMNEKKAASRYFYDTPYLTIINALNKEIKSI